MKYARIVSYVANEVWAIAPDKLTEIVSALAFRAAGHELTAEDIQARIGNRGEGIRSQGRDIAVVPIRGTIAHRGGDMAESSGGASTERIGAMLAQVANDPDVGTILLDVDSPGGTVTGVPELAARLRDIKGTKRIVAMVNGMAASAAYWLASQADEIVSIPSGVTGSIGVFTAHTDLSKALEQEGIKVTLIKAGRHKVDGNPYEPLSDEAQAFLQGRVDEAMGWFVADVAAGRKTTAEAVRGGYGEGRALHAEAALKAGLIDRIETVDAMFSRLLGESSRDGLRAAVDADDERRRKLELV